ncbi:uncharacterized protein IL334_006988 [Kwoniella shivajii]|uniref:Hyaluronan-mediated motility receptor C-terminal domain-containing protein n=1 Tax=Kwoniella shivajii TaxID=564305 RepID=A0ABZ1D9I7_9TREE|nr:hypothetical protein IL334_006988 [Kwoniella shivajii]
MATSSGAPLGLSSTVNIPREKIAHHLKSSSYHHDAEYKLKKVSNGVADQRRTKAVAEESSGGTKNDQEPTRNEVVVLTRELEKARGRITRRDETIKYLENRKNDKVETTSSELENKLADLVKRHQASRSKYQAQISILQSENSQLQQNISTHLKETIDLRKSQETLESENAQLRNQVDSLRQVQSLPAAMMGSSRKQSLQNDDERLEWKVEKHRMERHTKVLEHELEITKTALSKEIAKESEFREKISKSEEEALSLREEIKRLDVLQEENERMEDLVDNVSIAYRILYRDSISKKEYQSMKERYEVARSDAIAWQNKAKILEGQIRVSQKEVLSTTEQLKLSETERNSLESNMKELLVDRQQLREDCEALAKLHIPSETLKSLKTLPTIPALDLAIMHNTLSTSYYQERLDLAEAEYHDLLNEYEKTRSSLTSSNITLTALQRSFAELKTRHSSLEQDHSPCPTLISDLRMEISSTRNQVDNLKMEIEGAEEDKKRSDKQAREDREALKRANETVMRCKTAEEALDEEIQHLQQAYTESAKYEEMYLDLQEKYDLLESREVAAVDEAERLGVENAELAGHNNGDQKINYVEGVRREMVLVKQELASTRHLLNMANDRVITLENENDAYKSINPISSLGSSLNGLSSSRTRVMRRQPEGGRLTVSRSSVGGKGRSVSGPVGR